MSILNPKLALEASICNYLTSASFASGSRLSGSNYKCYTGMGNVDLAEAPAIIVDGGYTTEVIPFSRCYNFDTKVAVKEMAADTTNIGALAQLIFNEFVNTTTAAKNFTNPAYNISVWQVVTENMEPDTSGDALVNMINLRIVGALVPGGS